jgi:hypothetical protein
MVSPGGLISQLHPVFRRACEHAVFASTMRPTPPSLRQRAGDSVESPRRLVSGGRDCAELRVKVMGHGHRGRDSSRAGSPCHTISYSPRGPFPWARATCRKKGLNKEDIARNPSTHMGDGKSPIRVDRAAPAAQSRLCDTGCSGAAGECAGCVAGMRIAADVWVVLVLWAVLVL